MSASCSVADIICEIVVINFVVPRREALQQLAGLQGGRGGRSGVEVLPYGGQGGATRSRLQLLLALVVVRKVALVSVGLRHRGQVSVPNLKKRGKNNGTACFFFLTRSRGSPVLPY